MDNWISFFPPAKGEEAIHELDSIAMNRNVALVHSKKEALTISAL
ncbi:hypothetical protein [Algoriphagus algorifonticola]|nr:hypothetical protein [Algoriphagus algorifonticola]